MPNDLQYEVELSTAKAEKQLQKLGRKGETVVTGGKQQAAAAKDAERSTAGIAEGLGKAKAALGKIAAVMAVIKSITAPIKAALDVSKLGDEIDKTSQKLGMSYEAYQRWGYIAQRTGADMSSLSRIVRQFNASNAGNAGTGKTFEDAVKEVQALADATAKAKKANELFGSQYSRIMPLLNMTSDQMQDMVRVYDLLGASMSDDLVTASYRVQDSLTNMRNAWQGLKNQLAASFLPIIKEVVDWITALVAVLSKAIAGIRALFGGSTVSAASSVASASTTIAGGMASAAGSAKALRKSLMGFDELNMLTSQSGGGGGGGGSSASVDVSDGGLGSYEGDYNGLADKISKVTCALQKVRDAFAEINDKLHITDGLKRIFETIVDVYNNYLVPAIGEVKDALQTLWENEAFQALLTFTFSTTFSAIGDLFEYTGKQIAGTVRLLSDYIAIFDAITKGDFKTAAKKVKDFWATAADIAVTNNLELIGDTFSDVVDGMVDAGIAGTGRVSEALTGMTADQAANLRNNLAKNEAAVSHHVSNMQRTIANNPVTLDMHTIMRVAGAGYSDPAQGASALARSVNDIVSGINPTIRINSAVSIAVPDMTYAGNRAAKEYADGWNSAHLQKYGEGYYYKAYTPTADLQHLISAHATGGIIQKPILAGTHLMGEAGREAIIPLDNNTEWADIVAERLSAAGNGGTVVLQVDGRQLGYAAIRGINGITRASGKCQLAL